MRKIFLMMLLFCLLLITAAAQAAQITDVKWGVNKNNVLRIVVDVTETAGYAVDLENSTVNLTVNAKKTVAVPSYSVVKSSLSKSLQVLDKGSYTVIRLPLQQKITAKDYKAFVLKKDPTTGRPFRVVLDISSPQSTYSERRNVAVTDKPVVVSNKPTKTRNNNRNNAVVSKPNISRENNIDKVSADKKKAESTKAENKRKTTAIKTNTDNNEKKQLLVIKGNGKFRTSGGIEGKIITLDAGHGGSDPGAIGSDGTKEKDITLSITKMVKEMLDKKGAKVYMTRTADTDVHGPNASDAEELQARVNIGEKYNSDLFISMHINSSVNKNIGGFSTYYYPKTDNDLRIARSIQQNLAANFGVDDLGVRQANFYVVKRISMPAALVEMCFISNEKELTLMKGKWFQKKTARLIAEAIEKYFG